jgi:hypothetical protein
MCLKYAQTTEKHVTWQNTVALHYICVNVSSDEPVYWMISYLLQGNHCLHYVCLGISSKSAAHRMIHYIYYRKMAAPHYVPVCTHVFRWTPYLNESLHITGKWPLPSMYALMYPLRILVTEWFITYITRKWSLPTMYALMPLHISLPTEWFTTLITGKWPLSTMYA